MLGGHLKCGRVEDLHVELKDCSLPIQVHLTDKKSHLAWEEMNDILQSCTPFQESLKDLRIAHCSYRTRPWSPKELSRKSSLKDIKRSCTICNHLNFQYFLVHLPDDFLDIELFLSQSREIACSMKGPCTLLFENSANLPQEGNVLPDDPLKALLEYDRIMKDVFANSRGHGGYGFCIDTANLFSRGVELESVQQVDYVIESTLSRLPLRFVHLNGNKLERGVGRDIHTGVTYADDKIWGESTDGLVRLYKWCVKKGIPMILERASRSHMSNYENEIQIVERLAK